MKKKWIPLILTAFIVLIDQITKALIVHYLPIAPGARISESVNVLGDFLRFTHIRNTAILFSLGDELSPLLKLIFFVIIPSLLLILLVVYYFRSREIKKAHRWIIAGILGGGIGNMLDRIIRTGGVVDFIDVKFFGIFGMNRWPTFNLADSSIVISAIILIIFLLIEEFISLKKGKTHEQEN